MFFVLARWLRYEYSWYEERTPAGYVLFFQLATPPGFQVNQNPPKGNLVSICQVYFNKAMKYVSCEFD